MLIPVAKVDCNYEYEKKNGEEKEVDLKEDEDTCSLAQPLEDDVTLLLNNHSVVRWMKWTMMEQVVKGKKAKKNKIG